MTFSRLLPLLLLVPALTMADEDRNFKLTSENFKVGSLLEGSLLEKASRSDTVISVEKMCARMSGFMRSSIMTSFRC